MKAPASKAAKTGKPTTKGAASRTSPAPSKPKAGAAKKAPAVTRPAAKAVSSAKANAKTTPKAATKAATRTTPKPAAKPVAKAAVKPAAKAAAKPVKAPAKAPAKAPVKVPAKAATKAPAKPASKTVAKSTTPTSVKAPAKAPARKAAAPVAPQAPAAKPAAAAAVKPAAAAPAASQAVKPAPRTADKPASVPSPTPAPAIEPTPRPLGKRAAKKVMMEQMTQAEVVPTHAPDAAKATFTPTIARVMTPPVTSSIQKDPKRANNWKTLPVEQLTDQDIQAMPDSEYMGEVQLAFFRRKLQQLKADMLANAGETTEHLREDTVVVPDPADRATIEEEHALELRTRDRERKLLKKIEQAIARIDAGDYGYCEETGEPIGVARLMARPTASLSLEAQQRRELKQKMFGD